ncbi:FISUMP domain-containing protein [Saprospira sp. CCB-QB6]|uniref:FISUMP domain-containing protein n=1 Tax=Saprospira sp. CCB-QB6 TaxID=3023936 RepID=UPI00234BFD15|nr:FISUMP domain-containing protein [Saprospira sp. CCB-QB6]WCL81246.1 FISUMP domain-containing protein [Saprospira sp. CCB-QB6]
MTKCFLSCLLALGLLSSCKTANSSGSFTDNRDGQSYKTVKVGGNVWMAENLRFEQAEGQPYGKKESEKSKGLLYTLAGARNACPDGWHLPSVQEWEFLLKKAGGYYHEVLTGQKPKIEGTPSSVFLKIKEGSGFGFPVQPIGWGSPKNGGLFMAQGQQTAFWTNTEHPTMKKSHKFVYFDFNEQKVSVTQKPFDDLLLPCRCVQD